MPSASRFSSPAFTAIATLGLALALYLALLKLTALPCAAPGDCQKIIHSSYGSVFRLPVGLYASILWLVVLFQRDRTFRGVWLLFLAAGSAGFMVIQFAVLRGFCLYCTLHAVCTWAAFALRRAEPRPRLSLTLAVLIAAGGYAFTYQRTQLPATPDAVSRSSGLSAASGLAWLAPIGEKSPALVLSVDCPACLQLLEELTRHDFSRTTSGPAIYFKTTPANHALTREFIASCLAQKNLSIRDAFLASSTLLLSQKDLVLTQPAAAAQALAVMNPDAANEHPLAERILDSHARVLSTAQLPATTPLLLTPEGKISFPSRADELLK